MFFEKSRFGAVAAWKRRRFDRKVLGNGSWTISGGVDKMSEIVRKWCQGDPKVIPKLSQSRPKVIPKRPPRDLGWSLMISNLEWSWKIMNAREWSWMIMNDHDAWSWMLINDHQWSLCSHTRDLFFNRKTFSSWNNKTCFFWNSKTCSSWNSKTCSSWNIKTCSFWTNKTCLAHTSPSKAREFSRSVCGSSKMPSWRRPESGPESCHF